MKQAPIPALWFPTPLNSSLAIPLSGTATSAGQLILSPTTLDFGSVTVSQTKSLTATMSASGASVTISSASVNNVRLNEALFPLTLAVGQTTPLTIAFTLQSSGTASGSISFTSNAEESNG